MHRSITHVGLAKMSSPMVRRNGGMKQSNNQMRRKLRPAMRLTRKAVKRALLPSLPWGSHSCSIYRISIVIIRPSTGLRPSNVADRSLGVKATEKEIGASWSVAKRPSYPATWHRD